MYKKISCTIATLAVLAGGFGLLQSSKEQIVFADGTWEDEVASELLHPEQPKEQLGIVEETVVLETNPKKVAFIQQLSETSDSLNQVSIDELAQQYILLDYETQITYQKVFEQIKENYELKLQQEERARQEKIAAEKKAEAARKAALAKAEKEKKAQEAAARLAEEKKQQAIQKEQSIENSITEEQTETMNHSASENNGESSGQAIASAPQAASAQVSPAAPANNTIKIQGLTIPIVNAQGAGSAPMGDLAGYWQGSGDTQDNLSTHIIGHNPGIFNCVMNLQIGSVITVTDGNGHSRDYVVYSLLNVNDNGFDEQNLDRWSEIIGQSGEAISLQTCIDDFWNRMVLAR